jgi:hypothetical protein
MIKESVEEIAGWEAESALKEGGKYHNFICIRCRKIFTDGSTPLQHGVVRENVGRNKFVNFTFIYDGRLEQVWVRGSHGWEEISLRQGINVSEETKILRKKRNGGGRNG